MKSDQHKQSVEMPEVERNEGGSQGSQRVQGVVGQCVEAQTNVQQRRAAGEIHITNTVCHKCERSG